MNFASTRLTVADIKTMVAFYEMVTRKPADWLAPVFAEIVMPGATLAGERLPRTRGKFLRR